MSVEHRRQLTAFLLVALAAVLMIGNGLNNSAFRDAINGGAHGRPAAIAAGVTLVPGPISAELGGSAHGTTVVEADPAQASSGTASARARESRGSSPIVFAPGKSEKAPSVQEPVEKTKLSAKKNTGKGGSGKARTVSGARVTADATKLTGKRDHEKKARLKQSR
jgi:hypothetical protein